jgi:uncharacterized protein
MTEIIQQIAADLGLRESQVEAALDLLETGATVPFIARYRKERTGELDEIELRHIAERHTYLQELADRKQVILGAIADQGKLTPPLRRQIERCLLKTELEDLYLPYRPKRRTRAAMARERGLGPLAEHLEQLNQTGQRVTDLAAIANPYLDPDAGVDSPETALQGAADILAEAMAERADLRAYCRRYLSQQGRFTARIKPDYPEGSTKYEMYRQFDIAVLAAAPHHILALLRGEKEGILKLSLTYDDAPLLAYLEKQQIQRALPPLRQFYQQWVKDGFNRLMKGSLTSEVIGDRKAWADGESIATFDTNLKNLLLAPPAGMKPTLGIDPGFRTGCKVAAIDPTGQFLAYHTIFPHQGPGQRAEAVATLAQLIRQHQIALIAIGNGTAGRETDRFVGEVLKGLHPGSPQPIKVLVNESGASIYSASDCAIAEFPDLDLTVRGAISIARRLQDPLAELVKLEPNSIGVGQYQHDVDQKRLKQALDQTVESCVNYVGVDLNNASTELLTYVSGITPTLARQITQHRNQNGPFRNRKQLLKVPKLGPKAFEQAAGFLRIRDGDTPLDNTAVHPESYGIVSAIATDLNLSLSDLPRAAQRLQQVNLKPYLSETVGEPTLRDILQELQKPGRDPRAQFTYAQFQDNITDLKDLKPGMRLEGVVTNVANFGAFVDVGVHQDGLVHISQLADRFVKDPTTVVEVGQVVTVRVLEVNLSLKRISLSLRQG